MSRARFLSTLFLVPVVAHAAPTPTGTATGDDAATGAAGFDAHGFNLVAFDADVRDPLTVQRPGLFYRNDFFVGGVFEYANEPLVFVVADPATGEPTGEELAALDELFALNLSLGWALVDRVRIDVTSPLFFTSAGVDGPQGVGVGDLRAALMLVPVAPDRDEGGFGLGLIPYIDVPVGDDAEFLGQSNVSGGGRLAMTIELPNVTLGGDVGTYFGPSLDVGNLTGGGQLTSGLHFGVNPAEDIGINLEGRLAAPFAASTQAGTGSPSEAILSVRKSTAAGAHFLLGGATGVTKGASAAEYRVFAGGGYGRRGEGPPRDTDLDGIVDPVDACVTDPETMNSYKDEDGCPDGPSQLQVVVQRNGVPVSGASVNVISPQGGADRITTTTEPWTAEAWPGSQWTAMATWGECWAGQGRATVREGDPTQLVVALEAQRDAVVQFEVVDGTGAFVPGVQVFFSPNADACGPVEPVAGDGRANARVGAGNYPFQVQAPGYKNYGAQVAVAKGETKVVRITLEPTKVQLTEKSIVILEKVFFETNKAIIKPESFPLLNEVADTIKANPQIGRVEVGGHTDSQGSDSSNQKLSQARSESVRTYLASQGVELERLVAVGYGETRPIDTNDTPDGRAKNRRVEFNLIDKK